MNVTRRQLLHSLGSGAAAALCLQCSPGAVWPRRPVSKLDGPGAELLRQVYAAWKTLPASDPWSCESHRLMHLNQCSEHAVSGVDVHNTWDFLPWHRCFVHFHERVLIAVAKSRSINGAENFRLPYWDWDAKPEIPAAYLVQGSPLYLQREQEPNIGYYTTSKMLAAMLSPTQFQGSAGFGGDAQSRGVASSAPPHSKIHKIISDVMNDPDTSASDPLFYIHHANVDRLWEIWARHEGQKVSDYPAEFLAKTYTFPGAGPSRPAFTYRVRDILDTTSLGYTYDSYDCGVQFNSTTTAAGTAVVYVSIYGLHVPHKREGYFIYLKSKTPGIAPVELGDVLPFQSRRSKDLLLSATLPVDPAELARFTGGFQVVYKESESPEAPDAGVVPAENVTLLSRNLTTK